MCKLELAVRLHLLPGNGGFDIAVRLAGRNVDIIVKLHLQPSSAVPLLGCVPPNIAWTIAGSARWLAAAVILGFGCMCKSSVSVAHLGGHHSAWQEVDIGQVEEDRVHSRHPAAHEVVKAMCATWPRRWCPGSASAG